jgi:hypothetical protein
MIFEYPDSLSFIGKSREDVGQVLEKMIISIWSEEDKDIESDGESLLKIFAWCSRNTTIKSWFKIGPRS